MGQTLLNFRKDIDKTPCDFSELLGSMTVKLEEDPTATKLGHAVFAGTAGALLYDTKDSTSDRLLSFTKLWKFTSTRLQLQKKDIPLEILQPVEKLHKDF